MTIDPAAWATPETLEAAFDEYLARIAAMDALAREREARVHIVEETGPEHRDAALIARQVIASQKHAAKAQADQWLEAQLRRLL